MKVFFNCAVALAIVVLAGLTVTAQEERTKIEVFAGYSYMSIDTGLGDDDFDVFDNRVGSHGFGFSVTGNVHRYVGIKGEFSTHSKSDVVEDSVFDEAFKLRTHQFLGGVQFKDNKKEGSRFKPFAHVLAGVAVQRLEANGTIGTTQFNAAENLNNFAMVFGGGIDVRAGKHVDVRLAQFDYNPIFANAQDFGGSVIPGGTQHNTRFSVGIVIHD